MRIKDGDIIPAIGISNIYLGMDKETLISIIGDEYECQKITNGEIIKIENAKFWINNDNAIYQISVFGDFNGKWNGLIGIHSTLKDVSDGVGEYKYNLYCYIIPEYPGICFELKDEEDWDELTAPIEYISVYTGRE